MNDAPYMALLALVLAAITLGVDIGTQDAQPQLICSAIAALTTT